MRPRIYQYSMDFGFIAKFLRNKVLWDFCDRSHYRSKPFMVAITFANLFIPIL
ncbi:hypothetical protein IQ264_26475 [Phormidium sp. LEGE 05292]|uniref:hypothetical protein n=1 Tax=[Phormidium] sp. LEGE 05292 TaxID=767427 RepID=UPI00187E659B|nr:hypothetical protein [Phormidium sp. LEGE 05292]MBE9228961.1 hypothetical protein [Phormidium sp. LEGE 05292]